MVWKLMMSQGLHILNTTAVFITVIIGNIQGTVNKLAWYQSLVIRNMQVSTEMPTSSGSKFMAKVKDFEK